MGCVTFKQQFFPNNIISEKNFDNAVEAAKGILAPVIPDYQSLGWEQVYGGSGTMQALAELLNYQGKAGIIEYAYLSEVKHKLLQFSHIDDIDIPGLNKERTPVIISGLAILTALYQSLGVNTLSIACGALREGILYEMLPDTHNVDIRERTINSLLVKFHIDSAHANRIKTLTSFIYQQVQPDWQLDNPNIYQLLTTSCLLHEIGLILEFKNHPKHGAYIIEQADLPGFSVEEKQLIAALIASQKQVINTEYLANQKLVSKREFIYLATMMRLAILLSGRRKDDVLPSIEVSAKHNKIALVFAASWLSQHPLIFDELQQESEYLNQFNMTLLVSTAE